MTQCDDQTAKMSQKVLGCKLSHDWVVIEWDYEYTQSNISSYPTTGIVSYAVPMVNRKRAVRKMCTRCGIIETISY